MSNIIAALALYTYLQPSRIHRPKSRIASRTDFEAVLQGYIILYGFQRAKKLSEVKNRVGEVRVISTVRAHRRHNMFNAANIAVQTACAGDASPVGFCRLQWPASRCKRFRSSRQVVRSNSDRGKLCRSKVR